MGTHATFAHGYALLIGVGADLPVTIDDATALAELLQHPAYAAYPPEQVQLLTGKQADRASVLAAFDRLIEQVKQDTEATVIVYFSGHGERIAKDGVPFNYFLLPYGYDVDTVERLAATAISGAEVSTKIEAIHARKLLIFLDCCHANGVPTLKAPGAFSSKSVPLPDELLRQLQGGSGRVIITSSREDEKSYTGTPYSIFTTCLLEALQGQASHSQDGYARILDVIGYLLDKVPSRVPKPTILHPQHPVVHRMDQLGENFALCYYAGGSKSVPNAPTPPKTSITPYERDIKEADRDSLQQIRAIIATRLQKTRNAWAIQAQSNPGIRYQLEMEMQVDEAELVKIDSKIDAINQRLQS